MRATRYLAAAAAAIAVIGLAVAGPITAADAAAAPGGPVLTVNALAGPPVNPGDLLMSPLTPGTLLSLTSAPGGGLGLFCQSAVWQAQDLSNPAVPGTAVLRLLPPLKISGCKDSNQGVTGVAGVTVTGLPALLQVTGAVPYPIQISPIGPPLQIVVTLLPGSVTCTYTQASSVINGNTTLGSNPWAFSNQPFTTTPSAFCGPATNFFSASFSKVVDSTLGGAPVFVN